MPQIAAAVVAAIAYVGASATAVAAGAATFAQIATVAAVGIGSAVAGAAGSKLLSPQVGSTGANVQWHADPDEPLRFAFGRVGVKGSIKDAAVYGPDRMYVSFACTVSAAGPIKRFVSFRANDYIVSFNGAGMATSGPYANEMWLSTRLGAQPDTALSLPSNLKNGAAFPGWNSGRKLSGSAAYMVTLGENSKRSAYDGKVPAFLLTIEGLYCYDPRLDSTYPGGSGTCRLNDPATWVWTENPILFALKWALGLWEGPTGKGAPGVDYQVGGIGVSISSIHMPSVIEAANTNDANAWKGAAWPSTDDDKSQVLDGFLKAGGASYGEIAGKIAFIHRAAPRSTVFTVTGRDTAGPVELDTTASRLNRINTIRPRYWAENQEWQMTALPEVTATEWQTEDGQGVAVKRTRGVDYAFVPQAKQARELATLEIAHGREGIRGRVPLRPYMDPEPGNCFIFNEPDFALSGIKCFVLNAEDDTENDTVIVTFETETDGKYPLAYGQAGSPPPPQELSPVDPTFVSPPGAGDWIVTPRPAAPGGGLPGFDLSGIVNNATATGILVEFGPSATGPWTQAYQGPPTVTNIPLVGVDPGEVYYVAISYQRDNNYSERQVYGPYTAPPLVAGDVLGTSPTIQALDADIADLFNAQASETLIRSQETSTLAARSANRPNLIDNPSGAAGFRSWIKEGGPASSAVFDSAVGRLFLVTNYIVSRAYPAAPGQQHSLSYNAAPVGGGGVRLQYILGAGLSEGVNVPNTATAADQRQRSLSPSTAPAGTIGFRLVVAPPPAGATLPVWAIKVNFGATASDFTDDYSSTELQAEVTTTSLAVVDLENQQALAYYEVVAAAAGGRPARLRLISSSLGSAVALEAPYIYFGDNTVFNDATDTLQTTTGGRIRVLALGAPFGAAGNLLDWYGPTGVALSAMTTVNGYNGRMSTPPYVFDNVITAGGASSGAASGSKILTGVTLDGSSGWSTLGTFNVSGVPIGPRVSCGLSATGGNNGVSTTVQFRVIETGNGTVVAGPSSSASFPGSPSDIPFLTLAGVGAASGSVSYALQKTTVAGGGTGGVTINLSVDITQAL